MKNLIKKLACVSAIALGVINAQAIPHSIIAPAGQIILPGTSYVDTFDLLGPLTLPSYNPAQEEIISAVATFVLSDSSVSGQENITVNLEGEFFGEASNFFFVGINGYVNLSLLADNKLQFEIVSAATSVVPTILGSATLQFQTAERSQPLPDGGSSLALLCGALVVLSSAGRRIFA